MSKKYQALNIVELEAKRGRYNGYLLTLFDDVAKLETQASNYDDVTSQHQMERWEAIQQEIKETKAEIHDLIEDIQEITNIIFRESYLDVLL